MIHFFKLKTKSTKIHFFGENINLKSNILLQFTKSYNHKSFALEKIQNYTILKSGITELDRIIGYLKTGETTFIDGDNNIVSNIEKQICVNHYKLYKKNLLYIDGGMNFNPYGIAKYARECEIDHREALEHIHISRVFTLFQLNTILQERLEQRVIDCSPKILIIGKFLTPYLDSEVTPQQVNIIMKNNLKKIRDIAEKYGLIVILSNSGLGIKVGEKFKRILYKNVDEIITIKQVGKVITFDLMKKSPRMIFSLIEKGQLSLNNFGEVVLRN